MGRSGPRGPVYVTLPREILASPFPGQFSQNATIAPASPPAPDPDTLDEAAKLLGKAERPLLITANGGRSVEAARAIQQLAETFAVPVIHYRPRYLALPTEHPLAAGWDPQARLPQSDLIPVVDCDVPRLPSQVKPSPEATVLHL